MHSPSRRTGSRSFQLLPREQWLALGIALLALLACLLPAHNGAAFHSHDFADSRIWLGIPCTLDVLSNLPFAVFGIWGLALLARLSRETGRGAPAFFERCAALFFVGLLCTSAGSALYHWRPDDTGLLWDRAGMAVAFAGMLGMAACERVSGRAGVWLAGTSLFAGLLAVLVWRLHGNVVPWATVQFGGMAIVLALALLPTIGAARVPLGLVILAYAAAKALETADHSIYLLSDAVVSGHTLKHIVASLAALPVLQPLRRSAARSVRHNPAKHPRAAA